MNSGFNLVRVTYRPFCRSWNKDTTASFFLRFSNSFSSVSSWSSPSCKPSLAKASETRFSVGYGSKSSSTTSTELDGVDVEPILTNKSTVAVTDELEIPVTANSNVGETFTLEGAIGNSKFVSYGGLLRDQFGQLSEEKSKSILDCYNDLLPYPELLDEVVALVDEEILDLVFSDIDIWERLVLLESSIHKQKLYDIENGSDKEKTLEINSSTEPAKKKDEQKSGLQIPHLWTRLESMNHVYHHFGCQSLLHGHPLVLDCAFEQSMRGREITSYEKQMETLITQNMKHYDPYHIHLCNMPEESYLKRVGDYPVTRTTKCYTELFDKRDLIMLTPDAPLYMEHYDSSKIYIIGGIVDLSNATPLTYSKAQALGIQTARLPIDISKIWTSGSSKRLTLTAVLGILADLKSGKSWEDAILPNLPRRYHKTNPNCTREVREQFIRNVTDYKKRFEALQAGYHAKNNPKARKGKKVSLIKQMSQQYNLV